MSLESIGLISCLLPLTAALYFLIPWERGKNWVLLAAGLLFYAFGSLPGVALLLLVALVNYLLGLLIRGGKLGKLPLILGVVGNLAFLGAYKYLDFLLSSLSPWLAVPTLGLAAPLGVSFFTFKCVSYLVDAYRDRSKATRSFPALLLYISFFPQIAAGPITRFDDFSQQLTGRRCTLELCAGGLRRFVAGMGKKLILAGIAAKAVDGVFALDAPDLRLAWLGAVAYLIQIYFDFSGYSDMAIGLGQFFGFQTPENFNYPYISASVTEFWRRWHISLSSWFRDYVYIPLGGNRKGKGRAAWNKFVVFALCGLWHGAAWTFLAWGVWHGIFSALESLRWIDTKKLSQSRIGKIACHVYTLLVVLLGFVLFRAESLAQGFQMVGALFTGFSFTAAGTVTLARLANPECLFALCLGAVLSTPVWPWLREKLGRARPALECAACLILLLLCLGKLAAGDFAPFIYVQF